MVYLICGTDQDFSLNKEIKKNLKQEIGETNEFNILNFDLNTSTIEEILDECSVAPFLDDKKGVIVKNAYIFASRSKNNQNVDLLLRFLDNFPSYLCLIFVYPGNVDEKKPIFKKINEIGRVISIENIKEAEWPIVIGQLLTKFDLDITDDGKEEFIYRTSGDVNRVIKEISKLKTYGGSITKEIVCNLVDKPLEENMFGMVDAILNNDFETSLKIFRDLVLQGQELVSLSSALATSFRFLYQVKYLKELGLKNDEIASQLNNIKSGRVFFALKKCGNIDSMKILSILSELSNLDNQLRMNLTDRNQRFELFLVQER